MRPFTTSYNIPSHIPTKIATLKKLRAQILRLNSTFHQRTMLDTEEHDKTLGEAPSLHHINKSRKRQKSRTIKRISDEHDKIHSTSTSIIQAFALYFNENFKPIHIDVTKPQLLLDCELRSSSIETNAALEAPISLSEIRNAIAKGNSHKAPGNDGIGLEFYKAEWETIKTDLLQILNSMYIEGTILKNQLKRFIVCIINTLIQSQLTTTDH